MVRSAAKTASGSPLTAAPRHDGAAGRWWIADAIAWCLFVRSQRRLITFLRDRADRAAAVARREAREDARPEHRVQIALLVNDAGQTK